MNIKEELKLMLSIGTKPSEIRKRVNKLRNRSKKIKPDIDYDLRKSVLNNIDYLIDEWNMWASECNRNEEKMHERNYANDQMKHFMIKELERVEDLMEQVNNL